MEEVLQEKFQHLCDYFDFLKLSRCLEKLEDEGFEPYSVAELKETAEEHFTALLDDLRDDPNLNWVKIEGDHLELVFDDGELLMSSKLVDSATENDT